MRPIKSSSRDSADFRTKTCVCLRVPFSAILCCHRNFAFVPASWTSRPLTRRARARTSSVGSAAIVVSAAAATAAAAATRTSDERAFPLQKRVPSFLVARAASKIRAANSRCASRGNFCLFAQMHIFDESMFLADTQKTFDTQRFCFSLALFEPRRDFWRSPANSVIRADTNVAFASTAI